MIDADDLLEGELGEPIADFFEREGEAEFRRREERLVVCAARRARRAGRRPGLGRSRSAAARSRASAVREALAQHLPVWCDVDEEIAWERASGSGAARWPRTARSSRGASPRAARPTSRSPARSCRRRRRSRGRGGRPWLAAMQSAPGVAHGLGASPRAAPTRRWSGEGAIGLLDDAREALPDAPARAHLLRRRRGRAARTTRGLLPRREATIEVEGAESSKTISEAERVLGELAEAGARRDDCVLAFGGGVVGDLAGFCAATYQRGVPLVQAPTTLVAQVDSAYGGKTGVDLPRGQELRRRLPPADRGARRSRRCSRRCPREELAAGFVEVVKTGLIAGDPLWERVRGIESLDPAALGEVIFECARAKIEVVAEDERDSGRRAVLNLGHTVGHAIEAATGLLALPPRRGGRPRPAGGAAALRRRRAAHRGRGAARLARPARSRSIRLSPWIEVVEAIGRDKKRTSEGLGFVLLERPGEPRWGESVEPDRVRAAVEELR